MFYVQSLPIVKNFKEPKFFEELFHCDLCLGTWIYFILFAITSFQITVELFGTYIPVVSEMITAMCVSYFIHLFLLGVKVKWGTFEV